MERRRIRRTPDTEVFTECAVFDGVPTDSDPERTCPAKDVNFGGLLGDQCGLALRENEDTGDEFESSGGSGEVSEHHQRLMERRVDVVIPSHRVNGRVGTHDVVECEQVVVPKG